MRVSTIGRLRVIIIRQKKYQNLVVHRQLKRTDCAQKEMGIKKKNTNLKLHTNVLSFSKNRGEIKTYNL